MVVIRPVSKARGKKKDDQPRLSGQQTKKLNRRQATRRESEALARWTEQQRSNKEGALERRRQRLAGEEESQ